MDRKTLADRLRACEAAFRHAQKGNDWVRYRAALAALHAAERQASEVLSEP